MRTKSSKRELQTMKYLIRILLLFFLTNVSAEITIEYEDSDSFSVYLDGVMVMRHSKADPMFAVGIGDTFEAEESEGNYQITDTVGQIYQLEQFIIGKNYGLKSFFLLFATCFS